MEKFVSIDRILEEIYASEGYAQELDWGDALMWTGKALGLINAPALYIEKTTGNSLVTPNITVEDYRGELPVDFVTIMPGGVRDAETKQVYDHSSDSFRTASAITKEEAGNIQSRLTYIIKNNYIETSVQETTLEMAYRAFMIDDNGFPMVPDNERVIEAVRSYITFKTDHKLWRLGKLSENVYRDSEKEWLWYVGSAQNALRIMSVDRAEVWSRHWTRLLPVMGAHGSSYAYLGNREDINIGFNTTL